MFFVFRAISPGDAANQKYLSDIRNRNSVAIHVRLGDYVENKSLGGLAGGNYYKQALRIIKSKVVNPCFYVFSNDTDKALNLLGLTKDQCHIVSHNKGESSFRDMHLMSECAHHIIPNSSFSWWAAYLSKNDRQLVIAPKSWARSLGGLEVADMNLPSWIVLNN